MTNSGKAGASTRRVVHGLRSATGAEGTLTAEENQRKRAKRRFKTFGTQGYWPEADHLSMGVLCRLRHVAKRNFLPLTDRQVVGGDLVSRAKP